jgi:hypothetical protein
MLRREYIYVIKIKEPFFFLLPWLGDGRKERIQPGGVGGILI